MTDAAVKYRALLIACTAIYGPMGPMMAAWLWALTQESICLASR